MQIDELCARRVQSVPLIRFHIAATPQCCDVQTCCEAINGVTTLPTTRRCNPHQQAIRSAPPPRILLQIRRLILHIRGLILHIRGLILHLRGLLTNTARHPNCHRRNPASHLHTGAPHCETHPTESRTNQPSRVQEQEHAVRPRTPPPWMHHLLLRRWHNLVHQL